jgi:hypothetical protein
MRSSRAASASSGGRSGKTSEAHAGDGAGMIDQLVVRSLTILPDSLTDGRRSLPERTGSRSESRPGADGPDRPILAARWSPSASTRAPYQSGTKSSVSSRACAIRARLIQGSNQATSTNLAPCRYALAAIARVSCSLPGSHDTATIWSR